MLRRMAICIAILVAAGPDLIAQADRGVPAGTKVRVHPRDGGAPVVGAFVSPNAETLRLKMGPTGGVGRIMELPRGEVGRFEVSRGVRTRAGTGAVVGLLAYVSLRL